MNHKFKIIPLRPIVLEPIQTPIPLVQKAPRLLDPTRLVLIIHLTIREVRVRLTAVADHLTVGVDLLEVEDHPVVGEDNIDLLKIKKQPYLN